MKEKNPLSLFKRGKGKQLPFLLFKRQATKSLPFEKREQPSQYFEKGKEK